MNSELLVLRIAKAQRYLAVAQESLTYDWPSARQWAGTRTDTTDWLRRLALIHPDHYRNWVPIGANDCPVRGARSFAPELSQLNTGCQSQHIWYYLCACSPAQPLIGDHWFPWSLGGPTIAPNKILLCGTHNGLKSGDIHFFCWECGEPSWLEGHINRIAIHRERYG